MSKQGRSWIKELGCALRAGSAWAGCGPGGGRGGLGVAGAAAQRPVAMETASGLAVGLGMPRLPQRGSALSTTLCSTGKGLVFILFLNIIRSVADTVKRGCGYPISQTLKMVTGYEILSWRLTALCCTIQTKISITFQNSQCAWSYAAVAFSRSN